MLSYTLHIYFKTSWIPRVVLNLFPFSQNDPDTLPTELLHHDSYDSCSKDIADNEEDYKIWKKTNMEGKTENCCNITYNKKAFTTVS